MILILFNLHLFTLQNRSMITEDYYKYSINVTLIHFRLFCFQYLTDIVN